MLGCEGDGNAGVVAVSAYMCGTRGSCVLCSAGDVLEMSVVRGVGGVCDMCMYLARGRVVDVGGEWVTGLGLGFTNSGGTWPNGICVCVLVAVVWCGWCWGRVGFILLHLIDICFLTCICLCQISQIQTCLRVVVGPGIVLTSPTLMMSIASHPVGPHGRLAQKR